MEVEERILLRNDLGLLPVICDSSPSSELLIGSRLHVINKRQQTITV